MSVRLRRLWIQLTSDPRRLGVLCAVVGVAMLLWARLIVVSRMPRMAIAETPAEVSGAKSGGNAVSGQAGTRDEPVTIASAAPRLIVLAADARRDPFVISPRYFPKSTSFTELTQTTGKLPPKEVEEPMQLQARITAQLRALAEGMRLEAAVSGSMAVINGRTFKVGDVVPAAASNDAASETVQFRLVEVRQRSVMLECQDRQFEIRMNKP